MEMTDFEQQVYRVVRGIPFGEVRTYGQVAAALGNKNLARAVGNALHKNPSVKKTPCYRVVNAHHRLAQNYGLGGAAGQQRLLEAEGVKVVQGRVVSQHIKKT